MFKTCYSVNNSTSLKSHIIDFHSLPRHVLYEFKRNGGLLICDKPSGNRTFLPLKQSYQDLTEVLTLKEPKTGEKVQVQVEPEHLGELHTLSRLTPA